MQVINDFSRLGKALNVMTAQDKINKQAEEIIELNRQVREQKNQLIELAAFVTTTKEFYDWLLDNEPFRKENRIGGVRLALMFLAAQRVEPKEGK